MYSSLAARNKLYDSSDNQYSIKICSLKINFDYCLSDLIQYVIEQVFLQQVSHSMSFVAAISLSDSAAMILLTAMVSLVDN